MEPTKEIIKLKKRVKRLEAARDENPKWIDELARKYVIPGIRDGIKDRTGELDHRIREVAVGLKELTHHLREAGK